MARILYGVHGEGMGHATRSKVIINHLSKKHDLIIVSSNRAYEFLSKYFKNIYNIHGLNFVYGDNKIIRSKTFFHNMYGLPKGSYHNFRKIFRLIKDFKPQVIISDFEPFSVLFALIFRIPVITTEFVNMSVITSPDNLPIKYFIDYYSSRIVVRLFILHGNYHLITSFFNMKKRNYKKNVYIFPPILRDNIRNIKVKKKNHILVYKTSTSNKRLQSVMANTNENFVVYGFNMDKKIKNITYKKSDEKGFIRDLVSCKAVITNGGAKLIGEAIYLGKPVLSIPIQKQCEQILNAIHLKKLGYGKFHERLNKNILRDFLMNLDRYKKNLKMYNREDNSRILNKLDFLIKKLTK